MAQLPRYMALKSKYNNDYLRYVNETSEVQTFLQYSGDSILTPFTKFGVEQAKSDPTLVNIRCLYNNKYWVSWPSNNVYIVAGARTTEEDTSKWNCTLFQPLYDNTHGAFRFRHMFLRNNVCLIRNNPPFRNCLVAQWSTPDRDLCDLSTVIDWESLVALPKHIVFKGDNDLYLSARVIRRRNELQFASNNIGDPTVGMETFITRDGKIRMRSNNFGTFWTGSAGNWILAESTDTTTNNLDTLFEPIKVNNTDVIALRNLGNNNFIKRFSHEGKTSCLNAAIRTIDEFSRLQFEEAVLLREIFNVRFRALDSDIYDESILEVVNKSETNRSQEPTTLNFSFTYTVTESSTWNSSVSTKLGVVTTIQTGIPRIFEGKVEISSEFSGTYEWGSSRTTSRTMDTSYEVTVPPMTHMMVSLVATRGTCDIPYSYTQRDTLVNGKREVYQMDDGAYKGVNSYNFRYETRSNPITT